MAIGIGSDNVESGLVLAIDFANPKSYPGSGTTVYDLSGNNYNGTLTNGPTFSTEYGGALVFDGTNDSVNFNAQILSGTGDFTVSLWFRRTAGSGTVFGNYPAGNLQIFFGTVYLGMWLANSNLYSDATTNFTPNPVNMVVQRSGTTTYLRLNNILVFTASSNATIGTTSDFRIGTNTSGGEVFGGYFYSCSVYNRFLSTAEVAQNYNAEVRRFLPTIPVIDSSLVLNLDAGNRLSFLNYGGDKGFTCGGNGASQRVDKTIYATDTTSSIGDILPNLHGYGPSGLSDGATKGFICGQDGSPSVTTSKLSYSNDTSASATTANLSVARGHGGRISNYSTIGFTCGGYATSANVATTDRITYATEVGAAVTVANLSPAMHIGTSCISHPSAGGYLMGGFVSGEVNTIQKMNWATQLFTTIAATVSVARHYGAGISNFTYKGYILGGYTGAGVVTSDQFNFMTDTCSAQSSANLSQARYGIGNISEGMSKGYAIGGYTTVNVTTADKITFATDTTAAQTSANASTGKYSSCGLEIIYNTSSTSILDSSGNNNTSTLLNGTTFGLDNQITLSFDGSNDYVNCTNNSILQIYRGTICAWVYATSSNTGYRGIIVKQNAWALFVYNNLLATYSWGGAGYQSASNTIGNSTWNYVAMTFTDTNVGATNNALVYLNGAYVFTATIQHSSHGVAVVLGAGTDGAAQCLIGNIGKASVYNRVLSATEILQNFNADRQRFGV